MSIYVAIALAVVASVGFNVGTAFQKSAAVRLPKISFPPKRKTLHAFVTNRAWMTAFLITVASEGCFLAAAANAPISLVQPILGTGLIVLAGFSVFYLNEKLSTGEWIGVFTLIIGLALLGGSAERGEIRGLEAISWGRLVGLTVVLLGFVVAARVIELRRPGRFSIELVLGAASGVMIGIGALFTRVMMLEFKAGNVVFGILLAAVVSGSGLSGMITQQGGFQRGRAITVTAILAVLNKVIAIFGGMFALGEVLPENAVKQGLRITALAALLAGTVLLARFNKQESASAAEEPELEAQAARADSS
jgi:drug/metabolite transporter (DMT)-like permease